MAKSNLYLNCKKIVMNDDDSFLVFNFKLKYKLVLESCNYFSSVRVFKEKFS